MNAIIHAGDNLDLIKEHLPEYLRIHYPERITRDKDGKILMRCPFHQDRNPSFSANRISGTWLFHCFSCGESGSLLDLHALVMSQKAGSRENIRSTAEAVGIHLADAPAPSRKSRMEWQRRSEQRDAERAKAAREQQQADSITRQLRQQLPAHLKAYDCPAWRMNFTSASPHQLDDTEAFRTDFIRALFHPDNVLWLGDMKDSGRPEHAANFQTASEWLKLPQLPERIAAGTFQPGSISRSQKSVQSSPFIVVECDDIAGGSLTTEADKERNKRLTAALVVMLCRHGLTLRALIDTGNKSLHAWFDRPEDEEMNALLKLAPGYHIDAGLLEHCASSPLRLPGCIHQKTGKTAALLYLHPKTF